MLISSCIGLRDFLLRLRPFGTEGCDEPWEAGREEGQITILPTVRVSREHNE